jgi:mannosyltransferase OCH1-like enzyme
MISTLKIPKLIHLIWIGPAKPPWEWMETWHQEGWATRVWREPDIDLLKLENRDKYDFYCKEGLFNGAADVARVEILKKHGGIYADADSLCLIPLDEWPIEDCDFFAGIEYDNRIGNGIIGCTPDHPIIRTYHEYIKNATILRPPCYTIGGTTLTLAVAGHQPNENETITIFPKNAFYPKWKHRGEIEEPIYVRQMWGTTKNLYKRQYA